MNIEVLALAGFLMIGFLFWLFLYSHDEVTDWHPDPGRREELEKKLENLKNAPRLWRSERNWHTLTGLLVGWFMVYALLSRRELFSGDKFTLENLGIPDLFLFLFGWIGINGRLPTLAHALQDWLKSGGSKAG